MKTKSGPAREGRNGVAKSVTVKGKVMVMLDQDEYQRLLQKADEWEPVLPEPNERGNYPVEALDVLLARKLLRRRRAAGLSQRELAKRAGIRVETLCRIETGNRSPSVRTVAKIDRALQEAEGKERLDKVKRSGRRE